MTTLSSVVGDPPMPGKASRLMYRGAEAARPAFIALPHAYQRKGNQERQPRSNMSASINYLSTKSRVRREAA